MDAAVSLVQAYLRVNGYFTVTEYPVLEALPRGGYQEATDLDILAVRFPGAGRLVPQAGGGPRGEPGLFEADGALRPPEATVDMLIGEVKEGRAELNRGARNPDVLRAALARFGCCPLPETGPVVAELLRRGAGTTPSGHRVRLVAFGSVVPARVGPPCLAISLGHVLAFLRSYLADHWEILHHAHFKDPALSFLVAAEKAARGAADPDSRGRGRGGAEEPRGGGSR